MPKFSIIVPVYNVEKYIKKCLDSIFCQTFKDFEVIVVNDGTKDNSMDIVKKYNVTIIEQDNQGLSEARNTGVRKAKGEYLIFVDSDDYIENQLLDKINQNLGNKPDIVRYQVKDIIDQKEINHNEKEFHNLTGESAFKEIVKFYYVEPAWLYAIKRKYYLNNNFSFKKNTYHEDFGLLPIVIFKSDRVNIIDYCGYCYVKRENSITTNKDYQKIIKRVDDTINHFVFLFHEAKKTKKDTKYFNSYIANSVIAKLTELKRKEYREYLKKVKKMGVFDYMLNDTKARKIKNKILKISPKIYYKLKNK